MLYADNSEALFLITALLGSSLAVGLICLIAVIAARAMFERLPLTRHSVLLVGLISVFMVPLITIGLRASGTSIVSIPIFRPKLSENPIRRSSEIPQSISQSSPHTVANLDETPGSSINPLETFSSQPPQTYPLKKPIERKLALLSVPRWLQVVCLVWILGSLAILLEFVCCWFTIQRLRRNAKPIEWNWQHQLTIAGQTRTTVAESDVKVPMATGVWRPMILLPRGLVGQISYEQIQDVLAHELAHIRRGDNLVLWLEAIVRILFWPILTLHWLLHDLSLTREEACDIEVMLHRDPIAYGETLLRLAEICIPARPLRLTTDAFRHGDSLAVRVRGILDPERHLSPRPNRTAACLIGASLLMVAIPLCGVALVAADDSKNQSEDKQTNLSPSESGNDDQQLLTNTLDQMDHAHESIQNLSVTTDYVKRQQFLLPVDKPVEMTLTLKAVLDRNGMIRSDAEGEQVNIEPDGKSVRLYRGRWLNVFKDGEVRQLEWYEDRLVQATLSNVLSWHGIDIREFTTHYQGKLVTEIIRTRHGRIAERADWDRRPVLVIETDPIGEKQKRRYRFWIDAERQVIVRRAVEIQYRPDQPWQAYTRIETHDYQQDPSGLWLPKKVKYESVEVTEELTPEKLSWSYEGTNRDWKVNQELPEGIFELEFPGDIRVNDHRTPVPPKTESDKSGQSNLRIKYDMRGSEDETKIFVEHINGRGDIGNETVGLMKFTRLLNGKSLELNELDAGDYMVARYRQVEFVRAGTQGVSRGSYLDSQRFTLSPGETKNVELTRNRGQSISGKVLNRNQFNGGRVVVSVCSENARDWQSFNDPNVISFDVRICDEAGRFQTEPLAPGKYVFIAEWYAPMTSEELQRLGDIEPKSTGTAVITVPESGDATGIEITLSEIRPVQNENSSTSNEALQEFLQRLGEQRSGLFGGSRIGKNPKGDIESLSLWEYKLRPGDARILGQFTSLVRLNLQSSNVSDNDLRELTSLVNLRELNLWHTKIGDAGIESVTQLPRLRSLALGDTKITDVSLPKLAQLTDLTQLELARTAITDQGLKSLVTLKQLLSLKLSETNVSDESLKTLDELPSLRGVTLDETQVTAQGLARLAQRDGFGWVTSEENVAQEVARRMSAGDGVGVDAMLSIGLSLPRKGTFKTRSVTAHPVTTSDRERNRMRFRVEWNWTHDNQSEGLFAELSVKTGTARVIETGVLEK